jgi:hypothetical protein
MMVRQRLNCRIFSISGLEGGWGGLGQGSMGLPVG